MANTPNFYIHPFVPHQHMALHDRKILITGGAGFIGSNLAEHLSKRNHVTVLDDLSLGNLENLSGLDVSLIKGSILDDSILKSLDKFDAVFHLAAIPGVQDSIDRPVETSNVNFTGTIKILEMMRKKDIPIMVFSSSCAIYGNTQNIPIKESERTDPLSPYATQKLASEHIIKNYREIYGINAISARFFNVYGPKQNPSSEYSAVIPKFTDLCLKGREPVIYGTGKQTRDFIYIKDLVKALELIAERVPDEDAINLGPGKEVSVNELADAIITETGCKRRPVHVGEKKGEVKRSLADISLARKILGWEPVYSFGEGVRETVEWMKAS